ncbi:hypothetical protein, partial [Actinomyces sp.]
TLPRTDVGSDEACADSLLPRADVGSDEAWGRLSPPRTDVGPDEACADPLLPRADVGSDGTESCSSFGASEYTFRWPE